MDGPRPPEVRTVNKDGWKVVDAIAEGDSVMKGDDKEEAELMQRFGDLLKDYLDGKACMCVCALCVALTVDPSPTANPQGPPPVTPVSPERTRAPKGSDEDGDYVYDIYYRDAADQESEGEMLVGMLYVFVPFPWHARFSDLLS
jgi:hypothetical protein